LCLVLGEAIVRTLGLAKHLITDPAFERSLAPGVEFRYKSNFVGKVHGSTNIKTNSFGCRDREYDRQKTNGTIRIVVMGDSVTFGQGVRVEETYPRLLERSLNAKFSRNNVELINFGVQGYTVNNQVARFVAEAVEFHPDIAIIAPISQDLNLSREDNYVDENGYLTKVPKRPLFPHELSALLRHVHSAYLFKDFLYRFLIVRTSAHQKKALTAGNLSDRLDLLEEEVKRFDGCCRQNNIIPIFCLLDLEANDFTAAIVSRLKAKFPELVVVDCSHLFGKAGWQRYGIPKDGHPNAEAHLIIARQIENALIAPIERKRIGG
jgi:hypothetical protein